MGVELVGIELQLKGYEGVMADMRALDQMLNGFRGKRTKIEIQSDISKTKQELLALKGALNEFKEQQAQVTKGGTAWHILQGYIEETNAKMKEGRQRVNELQYALKNLSSTSFTQAFNKISSAVGHMGSAMQSAGNALTRLTSPFRRFTSGMVLGAGYKMLGKFSEGLDKGFTRYDTMKKYPKIMAAFGYSNEEAEKSIKALDMSVRGLPTGLDEMVDLAQRFTATTGDIEKGTQLAIAANNAFLASMSTDTQKYQGMMQLQDVLGGKDMNAREWNSLVSSMTPAIVKMGESLGYTKDNMDEFIQTIRDGKMDNQKFIDQLIKIGSEGGVLDEMAEESKNTFQAFFANVGNAASRMTAGVIQALDEVTQTMVGKDVNQYLAETIIPGIDDMTASVKKWIKAHPEEIAEFFNSFKGIDFKSIARGLGEAMLDLGQMIQKAAEFFNGKDLSRLGRWMVKGNILGSALTIFGGLLKGSRHIIGGTGAGIFEIFKAVRGIKEYGLGGWLGTLIVGEDAKKGEKAIEEASKVAPKMGKLSTGLSKIFLGWGELATMVGGTALVGWGSIKLLKGAIKDIGEIGELVKEVDWDSATPALAGFGIFLETFLGFGTLLGLAGEGLMKPAAIGVGVLGALTTFASAVADLDMFLIKGALKNFGEAADYLNEGLESLKKVKEISKGEGIVNRVKSAVEVFSNVAEAMNPKRNMPGIGEVKGGLVTLDNSVVKGVERIAQTLKDMRGAIKSINKLNKTEISLDNIDALTNSFGTALTKVSDMLINMPPIFKNNTASTWSTTMQETTANMQGAFQNLVGDKGILAQIPDFISVMSNLMRSGSLESLKAKAETLGTTLTSVYQSLQGIGAGEYFASNIDNFRAGLKSLKFAVMHLQEISGIELGDNVVGNIKAIVTKIQKAFDQEKITALSDTIEQFKESIKKALDSFKEFDEDIEIKAEVKLSSGFESSVNNAVKQINNAANRIRSAWASIPTSLVKTIFATITANVDASGAVGAITQGINTVKNLANNTVGGNGGFDHPRGPTPATGGRISRNGLLYRSGGGRVFRPRGTDRIPAMLTEGEYVNRKQAVDFWGMDFMRRVNAMDVRGAMNALLTKAGSNVGIGRQSILNHTVNNNQRVNMTISSNNANHVGVQMGRFIGAL